MSVGPAIVVDGVWKRFERGEQHDSLRDLFPAMVRRIVGGASSPSELHGEEFWAVQDLSFEVMPGEALGIIGPNGAGKSTTLKLLNRILRPTRGGIDMTGRIAALIEVSSGFHQDLTGRENVFLQGAIMGMTAAEMRAELDAIIEFSGIGPFIDTPVKRYSSGMNARLGFAVAAHLRPDILLIDEVLSVGDMEFQNRCLERMREFKRNGVAIVFVTHDLQSMASLCDKALLLKSTVQAQGTPSDVIAKYFTGTSKRQPNKHVHSPVIDQSAWRLPSGVTPTHVPAGERLIIDVSYRIPPGSQPLGGSFAVPITLTVPLSDKPVTLPRLAPPPFPAFPFPL